MEEGEDEGCGRDEAVKDVHPRETGLNILTSVKYSINNFIIEMEQGFWFYFYPSSSVNKAVTTPRSVRAGK